MDHEAAFARAFILSAKRARFIQYLGDGRHRKELLERLNQGLPLVPGVATEVPGAQDYPAELEKLLISKGAGPSCHVLADGLKADGRELPLRAALDLICLHGAVAILSCVPGRLAYYKPEAPAGGFILEVR